jgi:PAS domain S-box-containing protein
VIVDLQGSVRFVNPAAAHMFGRAAAALLGHSLGFPIVTDQITEVDVVRGDGGAGQAEMRVVEVRWDEESALLLSLRDISERKQAEVALRASEEEFRSLAESMPQIVWITRADGSSNYFNQQWMDYTGLTRKESLGYGWKTSVHPEEQQSAWDAWQAATASARMYSIESRLRRADGLYRWWLIRAVPIKDEAGKIVKWVGTCTDIHDLKMAEIQISQVNGELRRQRAELQALFDLVPAMIWFKDTENNILRVNQRVADVAGQKAEDLEGKSMFEIYPRDAAHYRRTLAGWQGQRYLATN